MVALRGKVSPGQEIRARLLRRAIAPDPREPTYSSLDGHPAQARALSTRCWRARGRQQLQAGAQAWARTRNGHSLPTPAMLLRQREGWWPVRRAGPGLGRSRQWQRERVSTRGRRRRCHDRSIRLAGVATSSSRRLKAACRQCHPYVAHPKVLPATRNQRSQYSFESDPAYSGTSAVHQHQIGHRVALAEMCSRRRCARRIRLLALQHGVDDQPVLSHWRLQPPWLIHDAGGRTPARRLRVAAPGARADGVAAAPINHLRERPGSCPALPARSATSARAEARSCSVCRASRSLARCVMRWAARRARTQLLSPRERHSATSSAAPAGARGPPARTISTSPSAEAAAGLRARGPAGTPNTLARPAPCRQSPPPASQAPEISAYQQPANALRPPLVAAASASPPPLTCCRSSRLSTSHRSVCVNVRADPQLIRPQTHQL